MSDSPASATTTPNMLSPDDSEQLKQLFQERFSGVLCDFCGQGAWAVGGHLVGMPTIEIVDGSLVQRLDGGFVGAAITCKNCGNTKVFHPHYLGFRPDVFGKAT